jgi:DNA-binding NarL/FixJ family response regulator
VSAEEFDLSPLTARQRLVAELIADGLTDKAIEARLKLSSGGVRSHIVAIAERMNLDRTKNLRVQLTWHVTHDRFLANPSYRLPTPRKLPRAS